MVWVLALLLAEALAYLPVHLSVSQTVWVSAS
jgi:hypothetical protein